MQQRRFFLMLQNCSSLRNLYKIHAQIVLNGFSQKSSLLHKLLSCCITHGELTHASLAFEQSVNPSTTVWNQIIRGFSKSKTPDKAILLYVRLMRTEPREKESEEESDARPNGFTYSFLLNACSNPFLMREGRQFHCRILTRGFLSSVYVQTSLINMYAVAGGGEEKDGMHMDHIRSARRVFDNMKHKNVAAWNSMLVAYVRWSVDTVNAMRIFDRMPERDVFSWTTVIAGCARSGRSKQAVALFHRMCCAGGVAADQVTMVSVLSACADLGDLELGRRIHSWVVNNRHQHRHRRQLVSLDNALINMYVKCGAMDEAYRIFQEMPQRSVVSWTTMITGLVVHGQPKRAMDVFQQMQQSGETPDEVTFIGVLCACSLMRRPDQGLNYFKHMTQTCNIKPAIRHFGCIIDMLSKADRMDEALQIIEEDMPIEPNAAVWSSLLSGCRIHGDFDMASHASRRLLELEQQWAGGSGAEIGGQLAQLSNLYIGFGNWGKALQLRRRMVESGMRKPGGRSWILVHGVLHEFMAGDQNKQCDNAVYNMVRDIVERAKVAGYMPKISQVMLDVEEEEREWFLLLHSEKLAMAFGLIRVSDKTAPIRIVTNLRVCCDCHSFAEFISGSFKRDIIIRERNRFHHFYGSTCSCTNPLT